MYEFRQVTERVKRIQKRVRDRVVQFDSERARIVTKTYQDNPHLPWILRIAQGTHDICTNKTVRVEPDELFVGNDGINFCGSSSYPEWQGINWVFDEIAKDDGLWKIEEDGLWHRQQEGGDKVCISPEDLQILKDLEPYWANEKVSATTNQAIPDYMYYLATLGVNHMNPQMDTVTLSFGHLTPNHAKVVNTGYAAIRKEAEDWLAERDGILMGDDVAKSFFYHSIIKVCDGAMNMVERYGKACLAAAAEATDATRKAELEKMADGLAWISQNPARNFWEACQATLLYQLLIRVECLQPAIALGRFDQYLWPFLERELADGTITMDEAQETVDCFFLKANCYYSPGPPWITAVTGVGNTYQHTTIGGVHPADGSDATNPLTYMVLETLGRLSMHDPTVSMRVHPGTPDKLWECALATSRLVGGLPLFQNDDTIIPGLQRELGFTLEDARDFSIIGCQEIVGSGCDFPAPNGTPPPYGSLWSSVVLVMALNDGLNPMNNAQAKLHTGYLYEKKSIAEVKQAIYDLTEHVLTRLISVNNHFEYMVKGRVYHASLSMATTGCMEKGKDIADGGAKYNSYGASVTGIATLADSLSAIKYMCFDHDYCTTRELYDAFMANWEGYEELRERILNEVPHYGNDDPYVDEEFKWAVDMFYDISSKCYNERAKTFKTGLYGASDHVFQGMSTWATPDGRKTYAPLADATSPAQGRDQYGPTAIFNSCACFDHSKIMDGIALNIKIHPASVRTDDGIAKLRDMTRTYFEKGGMEVQYNIVSGDTLRAAQKNPDEYRDLVVRIAGFSAYFVDMVPELQNDIISRNEVMV